MPNTVEAVMSAWTLAGMRSRYLGATSSNSLALGVPATSTSSTAATRPIGTPLKVTFEPGSITSPARLDSIVSVVFAVKSPRNCPYTPSASRIRTRAPASPASQ